MNSKHPPFETYSSMKVCRLNPISQDGCLTLEAKEQINPGGNGKIIPQVSYTYLITPEPGEPFLIWIFPRVKVAFIPPDAPEWTEELIATQFTESNPANN